MPSSATASSLPADGLSAFMVEDSLTIRNSISSALHDLTAVRVVAYADGERQALNWLTQQSNVWDLLIVDLFLRQGSGLGILSQVQKSKAQQRIVVLSNFSTPDMRLRCTELGVDAVFDKSSELDAFIEFCQGLSQTA